jgi:hypothetical protein
MPGRKKKNPDLHVPTPVSRKLQVYAVDPSSGKASDNEITVSVPWEPLAKGPTGKKVAVIDYDAGNRCYYPPADLDDPLLLVNDGFDPSESEPRFHQQMVYAIASRTIQMFEVALGRDIHWRRADRFGDAQDHALSKTEDIRVLKLYPHAMQEGNAYYSPQAHGILFGYFTARKTGQGRNLPGQLVFTCLSQDIIAHEVTHAVIDGIRTYFMEPTNPDVLAFHEGFADLCALFSHFSQHDSLIDTIRRTGGLLYQTEVPSLAPGNGADKSSQPLNNAEKDQEKAAISAQLRRINPLIQLAIQFGQARGGKAGLRSALETPPNSDDIHRNVNDCHYRGSILVAAVFDAFFTVYMERADDLFRIYRIAGLPRDERQNPDLPASMAELLAEYANDTAILFFQLCARAIDYCPPIDLTFGDFLRALITVSKDLDPVDKYAVRDALMEAFRLRGIYSETASFYSEDALCWPECDLPPIPDLLFGSPNGLTTKQKNHNGDVLRAWAKTNRERLGLDPKLPVHVPSFHPVFRNKANGRLRVEIVAEIIQSRQASFDPETPEAGEFPFRAGVTLIIEAPELAHHGIDTVTELAPRVRFAIGRSMKDPDADKREKKQRAFAISQGLAAGNTKDPTHFQANFGLLHEEY